MVETVELVEQLLNGVTIGMVYVLLASGLSIVFGVMDVINFAHGEFFALGGYLAFAIAASGVGGFWVALLVAPIVVGVIGAGVERLTIRPLYGRNPLYHILLTFGLVLVFKDAIEYVWGTQPKNFSRPELLADPLEILGVSLPMYSYFVIVVGAVIAGGTWLALQRTRFGLVVRAGAQDRDMVRNLGIDIDRYYTAVFAFGVFLAAVAGIILGAKQNVGLGMGDSVIIPAFVIVVLGGLGSFRGAVVGGLFVGVVETLTRTYLPQLTGLVVFILMILVLLVRPTGLFGDPEWQASGGDGELLTSEGGLLSDRSRFALGSVAVIGLALAPLGIGSLYGSYWVNSVLVQIFIWALFALSLDFVMGYAGLVSLGHVLFFGLGTYAATMTTVHWSQSVLVTLAVAVGLCMVLAWIIGYLSIRVAGVYFAMITLAFAELARQLITRSPAVPLSRLQFAGIVALVLVGVAVAWYRDYVTITAADVVFGAGAVAFAEMIRGVAQEDGWTGSTDGLIGEPFTYPDWLPAVSGGEDMVGQVTVLGGSVELFYYLALVSLVVGFLLARQLMRAPFGGVLQSIRESEQRSKFLGYDTTAYKRRAFVVSGGLAGLAGGLAAMNNFAISPDMLHWIRSGEVVVMTILGGMGTLFGPMVGAGVYQGLEEVLIDYTDQWQAVLGGLFVLFVIFLPRGLVSLPAAVRDAAARLRRRGPEEAIPERDPEVDVTDSEVDD